MSSDPSFTYVNYLNMGQYVAVCAEIPDIDIIVQMTENNPVKKGVSKDKEKEIQEQPLLSAAETMNYESYK